MGSKVRLAPRLISLFPPHHTFVDVFGGSAAVTLAKTPAKIDVYNDIDEGLVNFFRVLRDPEKFTRLRFLLELTPYSRQEFQSAGGAGEGVDDIELARRFFVISRMCFSGKVSGGWGTDVVSTLNGMSKSCWGYLSAIQSLPEIHTLLRRIVIDNRDFRKIIKTYDTPETFFYCDPPYVLSTRVSEGWLYKHELTDEAHYDLVLMLLRIKGRVMISGYKNAIYAALDIAGWVRREFDVPCSSHGRTRFTGVKGPGSCADHRRIEVVWMNYDPPSGGME
jgi:DNA adenine methylase